MALQVHFVQYFLSCLLLSTGLVVFYQKHFTVKRHGLLTIWLLLIGIVLLNYRVRDIPWFVYLSLPLAIRMQPKASSPVRDIKISIEKNGLMFVTVAATAVTLTSTPDYATFTSTFCCIVQLTRINPFKDFLRDIRVATGPVFVIAQGGRGVDAIIHLCLDNDQTIYSICLNLVLIVAAVLAGIAGTFLRPDNTSLLTYWYESVICRPLPEYKERMKLHGWGMRISTLCLALYLPNLLTIIPVFFVFISINIVLKYIKTRCTYNIAQPLIMAPVA